VIVGLLVFVGLLVIFHRPIVLAIGRKLVLRHAAKENLKTRAKSQSRYSFATRLVAVILDKQAVTCCKGWRGLIHRVQ
jgi:hypothetical protein